MMPTYVEIKIFSLSRYRLLTRLNCNGSSCPSPCCIANSLATDSLSGRVHDIHPQTRWNARLVAVQYAMIKVFVS